MNVPRSALLTIALATLLVSLATSPAQAKRRLSPSLALAWLVDAYSPTPRRPAAASDTTTSWRDISPAGIARRRMRLVEFLAYARAIPEDKLYTQDRLTRIALITEMENELAEISCGFERWEIHPASGPAISMMTLNDYAVIETSEEAARYVRRIRASGRYLDGSVASLQSGLSEGKVASRAAVDKVIEQLRQFERMADESLAVWRPAAAARPAWKAGDRERFVADLRAAIHDSLRPALARYRAFLVARVQPAARPQEKAGLAALPGGIDCYRRMIRVHTSLELDPHELHQIGLEEVAKFRRDLAELGTRVLGTSDFAEIQRRLRTSPDMHFRTAAEIEAKARATLARAQAAVPLWFGSVQPRTPCDVQEMGVHEAPFSPLAVYRRPSEDGKGRGAFVINTYLPETRLRYETEALTFHESVPGHHLQGAVAMELTAVPEFRKRFGVTAFVEGWGVYAEQLAGEMGLYSSGLDSLGMLSFQGWRACRLVVDTGLHAEGWSRQQAVQYLMENSVLAENNIENEVDRYIARPGQALAYKVGQLEILRLRDEARARLGPRFDIRAFHDAVLGNGAVTLPVLRQQVAAYIATAAARP